MPIEPLAMKTSITLVMGAAFLALAGCTTERTTTKTTTTQRQTNASIDPSLSKFWENGGVVHGRRR
jgi:uncharacterized lipoprotein YajG